MIPFTEVTLTPEQIKNLNVTPIQVIPIIGSDVGIIIDKVLVTITYGSIAYATNTDLEFRFDGAVPGDAAGSLAAAGNLTSVLTSVVTKTIFIDGLGATESELIINKGISVTVPVGNPTAGDSTIVIKTYFIDAIV